MPRFRFLPLLLALAGGVLFAPAPAFALNCISAGSGNWSAITWTNCPSDPALNDTVTISAGNNVVLDVTPPTLASLTMASPTTTNRLTIGSGRTLTVSGALTFTTNATANSQNILMQGTGNINVGSIVTTASTSTGVSSMTCLSGATGTLTVTGNIALVGSGVASSQGARIDFGTTSTACSVTAGSVSLTGGTVSAGALRLGTGILTLNGTLSGTGTAANAQLTTTGVASIVLNDGTIGTGATVSIAAGTDLTTTGTSNVTYATAITTWGDLIVQSGTLNYSGANGTFTSITISNGGTLNGSNRLLTNSGAYTNNGTHSGSAGMTMTGNNAVLNGTGTYTNTGTLTLSTAAKSIASTADLSFAGTIAISGAITVTNNGVVFSSGAITGSAAGSTWVNAVNSTLRIRGALLATGTLTATANPNTIDYLSNAAQACKIASHYNIILSSGGAKTCALIGGTHSVQNIVLVGTNTWTLSAATTISNTLTIGTGSIVTKPNNAAVTFGSVDVSGTLNVTTTNGSVAFTNITVNTGGLINFSVAETNTVGGDLQVDGTGSITSGAGVWTFNAVGGGSLSGTANVAITNATFSTVYDNSLDTLSVSGTLTVNDDFTNNVAGVISAGAVTIAASQPLINNGSLTASGTITVTGSFTNNGTVTAGGTLTGGGSWVQGTNSTLNAGGGTTNAMAVTTVNFASNVNTVNYTGAAQTCKNAQYYNLTFSGSNTKTCSSFTSPILGNLFLDGTVSWTLGSAVRVNGNVTLDPGTTLNTGTSFRLDLGGNFTNNGTFTVNQSTVAFVGTAAQTIQTAGQNFWVLIDSNTSSGGVIFASSFTAARLTINGIGLDSGTTVYFNADSTYTIAALVLQGKNDEPVWMRSTIDGTSWFLDNTGANAVENVDVRDSDARQGLTIVVNGEGSVNSGNNWNWNFGGAGQVRTWWGTVDTDWSNWSNWDTGIPYAQDSVLIVSTATSMPTPTAAVTISSLTINSGASLTTAGFDFTANGTLFIDGTLTLTNVTGNKTFNGSVTISNGGVLNTNTATSIFNEIVQIDTGGTMQIPSTTGAKTFNGTLTIDGDLNVTAAETVTFNSDLVMNGTVSGASAPAFLPAFSKPGGNGTITGSAGATNFGSPTFTTTYTQSANLTLATLTVTGTTLVNQGTVTVNTSLTGTGGFTNSTGGVLYIPFAAAPGITTLTATAAGNIVNYNGAAQTCKNTQYNNLIFSGSGAKTCTTFTSPVLGDVTMDGTASWTLGSSVTINGDLLMPAGSFITGAFAFWVTGETDITGTLTLTSATGNKTFKGQMTVRSGGILNTNTAASIFDGVVTVESGGSLQIPSTTGTKTFNDTVVLDGDWNVTAAETVTFNDDLVMNGTVSGASATSFLPAFSKPGGNGTITGTAGATNFGSPTFTTSYTNNAHLALATLTITGTTFVNQGTVTVNTALAGTGGFTNDTGGVLNIPFTGPPGITTLSATAIGNIVNYTGAAQTCKNAQYYHLTFSGSGAKTCTSFTTTILGNLDLEGTASWTLGAAVIVNGDVTVNPGTTLNTGTSFRLDLGGDFLNDGTFTVNQSTVAFVGTAAQTIDTGGQAFWVLIDSNTSTGGVVFASSFTAAKLTINSAALTSPTTVYFNADSTFTITALVLQGAASDPVWMRSTLNGTRWHLDNTAIHSVDYVGVRDSDARLGLTIQAISGTNSNAGNNLNWNFGGAGQVKTWWGAVDTDWSNWSNWDSGIPYPQDSVLVVSTATFMPTPTAAVIISSLTINNGATLTTAGFDFTANGVVATSGTLTLTNATGNKTFNQWVTVVYGGVLNTHTGTSIFNDDVQIDAGGTLQISNTTGGKTFNGTVTIDGDLNVTAAETVTFNDNLVMNGTVSGGSATSFLPAFSKPGGNGTITGSAAATNFGSPTFTTAYTHSANLTLATLTITGTTVVNQGTMTVTTALNGTGGLTNDTGGVLNISLAGPPGITTLTANNPGNLVNYSGAAQTCKNTQYYNLIFSGSGAKTCTTFTSPILGDVTMDGTAAWTLGSSVTINGDLLIPAGTLTTAGFAFWITGETQITGTLTLTNATGNKTFRGLTTVLSGGILNTNTGTSIFDGDVQVDSGGTLQISNTTGAKTFNGTVTIDGDLEVSANETVTFNDNLVMNGTVSGASAASFSPAFSRPGGNGTITGSAAATNFGSPTFTTAYTHSANFTLTTLTITGTTLVNQGTVTVNTSLTGTGGFTNDAGGLLYIPFAGPPGITTLTANTPGNQVHYNRAGTQTCKNTQYYNLIFSGSGAKTCTSFTSPILGGLNLEDTASWTLGSAVEVEGDVMLNPGTTLDTGADFRLDLGGDFTNNGTFDVNESTIAFVGTAAQTIDTAGQDFWILIDSNTSSGGVVFVSSFTAAKLTINSAALASPTTVYFNSGSTFTIAAIHWQGSIGNFIWIRPTGSQAWLLNNTSTNTVSFVDVAFSSASAGEVIAAGGYSTDAGNNTNWTFGILSVNLSPASYDFTTVNLGATSVSVGAVSVTNSGDGPQTYSLSVATTGASVWAVKVATPTMMDTFVLEAMFNSVQPSSSTFHELDVVTSTPTASSASVYSGNETGFNVAPGAVRSLWMLLFMPPSTTTASQQSMSLTVSAGNP
jgi:hypothetical protein